LKPTASSSKWTNYCSDLGASRQRICLCHWRYRERLSC